MLASLSILCAYLSTLLSQCVALLYTDVMVPVERASIVPALVTFKLPNNSFWHVWDAQIRKLPSYNTEQDKQSFFPRTIIAWNKLNTSIVQASSPEAFKFKSALAVARRRWGAPTPRTQPRRNLRQTTDMTMRRKTLWRLFEHNCGILAQHFQYNNVNKSNYWK